METTTVPSIDGLADDMRARAGGGGDDGAAPWARAVAPAMRRLVLSTVRAAAPHLRKVRGAARATPSLRCRRRHV